MITRAELERVLRAMPNVDQVKVIVDGRLLATVVSAAFRGRHEGQRQATVWRYVEEQLGPSVWQEIEFIFTHTPEEMAA